MSAFDQDKPSFGRHHVDDGCPSLETISAFVDAELESDEMANVEQHLSTCPNCEATVTDFLLLQNVLVSTTPSHSNRSFVLPQELLSETGLKPAVPSRKPTALFPAFAAIAAALLIALLVGQLLSNGGSDGSPGPQRTGDVLYINGTPFTAEDNDAEFGAASTDVMNDERADASNPIVEESASEDWSVSRIALLLVAALGGGALSFWWFKRRTPQKGA